MSNIRPDRASHHPLTGSLSLIARWHSIPSLYPLTLLSLTLHCSCHFIHHLLPNPSSIHHSPSPASSHTAICIAPDSHHAPFPRRSTYPAVQGCSYLFLLNTVSLHWLRSPIGPIITHGLTSVPLAMIGALHLTLLQRPLLDFILQAHSR